MFYWGRLAIDRVQTGLDVTMAYNRLALVSLQDRVIQSESFLVFRVVDRQGRKVGIILSQPTDIICREVRL